MPVKIDNRLFVDNILIKTKTADNLNKRMDIWNKELETPKSINILVEEVGL